MARGRSLRTLEELGITPEDLGRRGPHPELGPVTLGQLLAAWVVHDLNHVGQIVNTQARQYDEAVGPWKVYLGILVVRGVPMNEFLYQLRPTRPAMLAAGPTAGGGRGRPQARRLPRGPLAGYGKTR